MSAYEPPTITEMTPGPLEPLDMPDQQMLGLAALREAFPAGAIGKLPRYVGARDSKGKNKKDCTVCGGYHDVPSIHLDYVGHAATTDRLLKVDPFWTWEPVAFDTDGSPLVKVVGKEASMWIRLTVCGVTRLGVGICGSDAFELEKQLIGDAIRNAAMRFGVALDLWSKEDLHAIQNPETKAPSDAPPPGSGEERPPEAKRPVLLGDAEALWDLQLRIESLPPASRDDLRSRWKETNALSGLAIDRLPAGSLKVAEALVKAFEQQAGAGKEWNKRSAGNTVRKAIAAVVASLVQPNGAQEGAEVPLSRDGADEGAEAPGSPPVPPEGTSDAPTA